MRYFLRMALRGGSKRFFSSCFLCAPMAIGIAAAQSVASDPAEQCIVGDHAIGCLSERSIAELTTPHKDAGALQQLVQDKIASGQCRLFEFGERVQVTSAHGSERTQIRRAGDKAPYWIASSWSRPAAECDGVPSAAALHRKLGLPDTPRRFVDDDERIETLSDARQSPAQRWNDDDEFPYDHARRPPPGPPRQLPSSRYAHDCTFKPVMSDADLIACRNSRR